MPHMSVNLQSLCAVLTQCCMIPLFNSYTKLFPFSPSCVFFFRKMFIVVHIESKLYYHNSMGCHYPIVSPNC